MARMRRTPADLATPVEARCLDEIVHFFGEYQVVPTVRELAAILRVTNNWVQELLERLAFKGYLRRPMLLGANSSRCYSVAMLSDGTKVSASLSPHSW